VTPLRIYRGGTVVKHPRAKQGKGDGNALSGLSQSAGYRPSVLLPRLRQLGIDRQVYPDLVPVRVHGILRSAVDANLFFYGTVLLRTTWRTMVLEFLVQRPWDSGWIH